MSAARRNRIKATKPLEPWPGGVPQHASEAALRRAQAAEWRNQYVVFDYGERGRVAGLCVECEPLPRMEPDDIPDFAVTVQSLKDSTKQIKVYAVANRCQFYTDLEEARRITNA